MNIQEFSCSPAKVKRLDTLNNTLNSGPAADEDEDKDSLLPHAFIIETCYEIL